MFPASADAELVRRNPTLIRATGAVEMVLASEKQNCFYLAQWAKRHARGTMNHGIVAVFC